MELMNKNYYWNKSDTGIWTTADYAHKGYSEMVAAGVWVNPMAVTVSLARPVFDARRVFDPAKEIGKKLDIKRSFWTAEWHEDKDRGLHLHGMIDLKYLWHVERTKAHFEKVGRVKIEPPESLIGWARYITKDLPYEPNFYSYPQYENWNQIEMGFLN